MTYFVDYVHIRKYSKVFLFNGSLTVKIRKIIQSLLQDFFRLIFTACLITLAVFSSFPASAKQIFFSTPKPTAIPLDVTNQSAWLKNGGGDDGYVKIEVISSLKNGCVPLGNAGFLKIFAKEEMQLTVSIRLTNISSALQGRDIPIAILDGRSNPGGCLPFTILDGGMTLVPLARLEPSLASVHSPKIELSVRSTSESKVNLVGPAQAVLGVATVFATGGAASTVAGLTSALAQPAFKQIERTWDNSNSGVTPGLYGDTYGWKTLRSIDKIVFPIFSDIASSGESDAQAIPKFQNDQRPRSPEFTIELRFSHYSTAFDWVPNDKTGLPRPTDISPVSVFNHPNQAGVPTVGQLLEPELTALSKAKDLNDVKNACNLLIARTRNAGFSLGDRAVTLYLAMDKTRASGWYKTELDTCAGDHGQVLQTIRAIWKAEPPKFKYADARKRYATEDANYSVWHETGVPFLDAFRKAVTEPRLEERERLMKKLSADSDIQFAAPSGQDEWPPFPTDNPAVSLRELQRFVAKRMVSAGCFTYESGAHFLPTTNPGDLLLLDEKGRVWVASPRRSAGEISKLASVDIFAIDENWKNHYEELIKDGYYGSPILGGCAQISSKLLAPVKN